MKLRGRKARMSATPLAHRNFESHAELRPQDIALSCGPVNYSYGDLNLRANQLAHFLTSRGVGPGSIVGICLHRSPEMVISVLAVLKAGAAYAPLDATHPRDRLRLMLAQLAESQWVIGSVETRELLEAGTAAVLIIEDVLPLLDGYPATNPVADINGQDLCYVVFTSGSTGVPKAAAVMHAGWCNLLSWIAGEFDLGPASSNLLLSSFGFDISQRSLMTPLSTGSTLHLLPSRSFDPMLARRLIAERGIRTLHCAPSTLYLLLDREATENGATLASLDYVFVGGEPLSASRLAHWADTSAHRCKLVNVYGVAECTDVSSFYVLKDYDSYATAGVPIGRPIDNTDIHVLDRNLEPVPAGEVGEICISGVGVGAGYLNAQGLNRDRFVSVGPARSETALYRTGDLGRMRSDDQLACVGRLDNQVKVRGMRLELEDVEMSLRANGRFDDAVVLAVRGDAEEDTELVACVIPSAHNPGFDLTELGDERVLRTELLSALPAHMVPQRFISVRRFPLNPNGKVDRLRLTQMVTHPAARAVER